MQELNVTMKLQDRVLPPEAVQDLSLAREALQRVGVSPE
jgi:hypothetical protein